jgi:hypothetical protein
MADVIKIGSRRRNFLCHIYGCNEQCMVRNDKHGWYPRCPVHQRAFDNARAKRCRNKGAYKIRRRKVLQAYSPGGLRCACCGETEYEFLSLDHKYNDGAKHRRELGTRGNGPKMLRWIRKNNYPPIFRVLCYNCNCTRGFLGYCPHERRVALSQTA